MTQSTATPTTITTAKTPSGLRTLYLIRVVFSLIWVTLVLTTCASLKSANTPTAVAAVLLVVYPLWDAAATLLEGRMAGGDYEEPTLDAYARAQARLEHAGGYTWRDRSRAAHLPRPLVDAGGNGRGCHRHPRG